MINKFIIYQTTLQTRAESRIRPWWPGLQLDQKSLTMESEVSSIWIWISYPEDSLRVIVPFPLFPFLMWFYLNKCLIFDSSKIPPKNYKPGIIAHTFNAKNLGDFTEEPIVSEINSKKEMLSQKEVAVPKSVCKHDPYHWVTSKTHTSWAESQLRLIRLTWEFSFCHRGQVQLKFESSLSNYMLE